MVARAPADGYTLLMVRTTFATTNSLFAKLPYDEVKDFAPVTLISSEPNFLMVHSSLPVKTVKELIALAKRRSGQLNYGFGGLGSTSNLSGLLFNQKTGVTIVGISYKSNGAAMVALLSGEVSLMFSGLPAALLPLKSGKLLALVVTGAARSPFLPDVPTMDEAGVRGYEVTNWIGMLVPRGASEAIVTKLNSETVKLLAPGAVGQVFPVKPVRLIVSFPPGAGPDIVARTVGQKLTERWGQQVIVDNRPGAGGNIATELGMKAAPDGYTLMAVSNYFTVNPSLFKKAGYDPLRDFAPVILAAVMLNVLVVHPSLPVKSVQEVVALAKAKPGQLNFSSGDNGSVGHLAGELFKSVAKVDMLHVPYKGPIEAVTALISGEVSLAFLISAVALPQAKSGKLRALAVTSTTRSPAAPDLPPLAESGLPGYDVVSWIGVVAPAATPSAIVIKLNHDIGVILGTPAVKDGLRAQGLETIGGTQQEFAAYMRADVAKWAKVVKDAHMHVD